MRHPLVNLICLFSVLFLVGCATHQTSPSHHEGHSSFHSKSQVRGEKRGKVKANSKRLGSQQRWSSRYINHKGFLNRPPEFSNANEIAIFDRCSAIKIVEVVQSASEISLHVEQRGKSFHLIGLNRQLFKLTAEGRLPSLDEHFVAKSNVLEGARKLARSRHQLCRGKAWKTMSQEQFLFLHGQPDKVIRGKGLYRKTYQWIYRNEKSGAERSYYFTKGHLTAWTL